MRGRTGCSWCTPRVRPSPWRDVIRALPEGVHAVAPDLRGAGAAVGAPAPRAVSHLVEDLLGVMDATGLRTATVVTQGTAAVLGVALAERVPQRVGRLVLVAPALATADAAVPQTADLARMLTAGTLATDPWASAVRPRPPVARGPGGLDRPQRGAGGRRGVGGGRPHAGGGR
ncbi:MAG: alpha/beta hydrolase [Thermoleophilia bacterium]